MHGFADRTVGMVGDGKSFHLAGAANARHAGHADRRFARLEPGFEFAAPRLHAALAFLGACRETWRGDAAGTADEHELVDLLAMFDRIVQRRGGTQRRSHDVDLLLGEADMVDQMLEIAQQEMSVADVIGCLRPRPAETPQVIDQAGIVVTELCHLLPHDMCVPLAPWMNTSGGPSP